MKPRVIIKMSKETGVGIYDSCQITSVVACHCLEATNMRRPKCGGVVSRHCQHSAPTFLIRPGHMSQMDEHTFEPRAPQAAIPEFGSERNISASVHGHSCGITPSSVSRAWYLRANPTRRLRQLQGCPAGRPGSDVRGGCGYISVTGRRWIILFALWMSPRVAPAENSSLVVAFCCKSCVRFEKCCRVSTCFRPGARFSCQGSQTAVNRFCENSLDVSMRLRGLHSVPQYYQSW
jgi:hypothetical protein